MRRHALGKGPLFGKELAGSHLPDRGHGADHAPSSIPNLTSKFADHGHELAVLLHQQIACLLQRQRCLLLHRRDRHDAHRGRVTTSPIASASRVKLDLFGAGSSLQSKEDRRGRPIRLMPWPGNPRRSGRRRGVRRPRASPGARRGSDRPRRGSASRTRSPSAD